MFLIVIGVNYKTAPVEIREKFSFHEKALKAALKHLKSHDSINGCVILSTCNRTEIYVTSLDAKQGLAHVRQFLAERLGNEAREMDDYIYVHTLHECVRHLFRVAAGLDSMILGEAQILGQVRAAYQIARECGTTNSVLNTVFQQAIFVGKRVRTETRINRSAVSISYAVVELGKQIFGDLHGKSVLIVGAGKMSALSAKHLTSNGVTNILVSNRSFDKAIILAEQFKGKAVRFDDLTMYMGNVDVVISCTAASHYIIKFEDVDKVLSKRPEHQLFLFDIAVPRNIDPKVSDIPHVELYDIDDLQNVVDKNLEKRRKEAVKANKIVEEEITNFFHWLNTRFVVPVIMALKRRGEMIEHTELEEAFNKLGELSEHERKVISTLAHTIVNQLLREPIINLKRYALTNHGHLYTETLRNLFNLEIEESKSKVAEAELKKGNVK